VEDFFRGRARLKKGCIANEDDDNDDDDFPRQH
jgi:hypothetical protein